MKITRDELKTILDQMYHIRGAEETDDIRALLLAEFDRLTADYEHALLVALRAGDVLRNINRAFEIRDSLHLLQIEQIVKDALKDGEA